jgi:DNA-binding transcriptional regulator YiaG
MEKELVDWYKLHEFHRSYDYQTEELAQHLKISSRTIQRWLKGKSKPSQKNLDSIKEYLLKKQKTIA